MGFAFFKLWLSFLRLLLGFKFGNGRINQRHIKGSNLLRRLPHIIFQPPAHHADKAAGNVADKKIFRYLRYFEPVGTSDDDAQVFLHIFAEEAQKERAFVIIDDTQIVLPLVAQMIKDMRDTVFRRGLDVGKIMGAAGRYSMTENMLEEHQAHFTRQLVLRFKVAVKGAAADIGGVDNILDADFFVAVLGKQAHKGVDNGLSCSGLASVHRVTPVRMAVLNAILIMFILVHFSLDVQ